MNTFIYGLHCLVVAGVPLLFGWTLLRRVFREANGLAVAAGAVAMGLVGLMSIVNELRFFWEMPVAVWSAYKLLLVLTLVIVLTQRRRPPRLRLPASARSPWKLAVVTSGFFCVGIYYGIPAFNGYLNDAWWYHYPAAVQIQTIEHFPLTHVFALDNPLYYHPGPDILAAVLSFLLELPVQQAWAVLIVVLAPVTFLLAFALMTRLSRSFWGALIGASVLIGGGNLRFLLFLTGRFDDPTGALRVFNSQTVQGLLQLVFTPSHLVGVPLVLVLLLLFRHFSVRPTWTMGAVFGLSLGALTLVAEWYFAPLVAGISLLIVIRLWRGWRSKDNQPLRKAGVWLLPIVIAVAWGTFNNTYLAGVFSHFWMRDTDSAETVTARTILASLASDDPEVHAARKLRTVTWAKGLADSGSAAEWANLWGTPALSRTTWSAPNLVPLRLNFTHFGKVPSWESAASSGGSFIPILGPHFLMEASPVLLLGLPFSLWAAWRRRTPFWLLIGSMTVVSTLPPIFLDWGYRSTDFLRFFTASYCYAALAFGCIVGILWSRPDFRLRALGAILATCALITPIGLGFVGLIPGTLDTIKSVASSAQSLSQVAGNQNSIAERSYNSEERIRAFESLATTTGNFLFPMTQGRDRVIVIVPPEQVPAVEYFPEWMKMATLSRIQLPVGWHWEDSMYSTHYRTAVTTLEARAIAALDAKWVILTNLFQETWPIEVSNALEDAERFTPVLRLWQGKYFIAIYQVRP